MSIQLSGRYWRRIYTNSFAARTVPGTTSFSPIADKTLPIVVDSHVLAVGVDSRSAKSTWRLGFWLSQLLKIEGAGYAEHQSTAIVLGLTLVRFELLTPTYQLKAKFPKWHKDLNVSIWKYTGNQTDPFEAVGLTLSRIESKIDLTNRG